MPADFKPSYHPLVAHKVSYLRQPRPYVSSRDYANLLREIGILLAVEACTDLPLEIKNSERAEISSFTSRTFPRDRYILQNKTRPVIIANVRSGLIMSEGVREIVPTPYMGHIGMLSTPHEIVPFIVTLPESVAERVCIVVDPFVVSGRVALSTLQLIINIGVPAKNIRFLTVCMSRMGHERLRNERDLNGVIFHCARIDGMGKCAPEENWIDEFEDLNERLFRTINKKEAKIVPQDIEIVEK